MYYPILRGKQNEFLALRELASLGLERSFCPVIEPVRQDFLALRRAIIELNQYNIKPIVIINPQHGDFKHQLLDITADLNHGANLKYIPCFKLHEKTEDAPDEIKRLGEYALFVTRGIDQKIIDASKAAALTFVNHDIAPQRLRAIERAVLCGDFFKRQARNADYLGMEESPFSSLHTYYNDYSNVLGFGDYTITGEEFSESGGPAYVVTIHLSYIDPSRFDEMFIRHYSSYDDESPANPGDKFLSALKELIKDINNQTVPFAPTSGLKEFISLNDLQHFPGLGQVKKVCIKHHIETLVDYLRK